ncbi:MAG: PAS domain-containing protein, partial [Planctomycetota bacterium]
GADYHIVKETHFASIFPLILAQWTRRDSAVASLQAGKSTEGPAAVWPDALDALQEGLVLVDADLTILQANQTAMKKFQRGEEDFVGKPYCLVLYGDEDPPEDCPILHALEKGEPAADDVDHAGSGKAFRVQAWPVTSYAGKVSSAIALVHEKGTEERAVADLQSREWLYRNLTEKAGGGVAMVGPDGKLHYINRALCTMLDQTEEELVGRPIEDCLPPQEQESLRECLDEAMQTGDAGARLVLQRADGSTFPAEARIAPFATSRGTHLVLSIISVQALEEAEQELWSEARKWSAVLDEGVNRLECGVVVLDAEGRVAWVNRSAADAFGRKQEEMLNAPYVELVSDCLAARGEAGQEFAEALAAAHQNGKALESEPLRLGDEEVLYWSTPAEDGAAISRVEHFYEAAAGPIEVSLPADHDALAGIAAAVPEMLFTTDEEGKITWCNPAAAHTSGYAADKLDGMALPDLAAPETRQALQGLIDRSLKQSHKVQTEELLMAREDGGQYWGELTLLSVREKDNEHLPVVQGALRDITDHKITEAIRDIVTGQGLP